MSTKELDARVSTLKSLMQEIESMTAEAEAIKDELKMEMANRGEETLTGTGWKASWKVIESSRIDTKALKAALPDVAERYTVTSKTSRFCLT